jgi:hypothetical protein
MNIAPLRALESGQWWEHEYPFRHFRASDLLSPEQFAPIQNAFKDVLRTTAGEKPGSHKLTQKTANYDALMLAMTTEIAALFFPLLSDPWITSIYDLLEMPYLNKLDGALHSSPPNSRTGWIHTDFCSAWFDESSDARGDDPFPTRARCDYFSGKARAQGARPVEYVRGATAIFYLCNEDWKAGDGGETGLLACKQEHASQPVDLVRPLDNTLLLFECSPHSYHRFYTNPGRTRNSLIFWLHCTVEYAQSRWGETFNRRVHQ